MAIEMYKPEGHENKENPFGITPKEKVADIGEKREKKYREAVVRDAFKENGFSEFGASETGAYIGVAKNTPPQKKAKLLGFPESSDAVLLSKQNKAYILFQQFELLKDTDAGKKMGEDFWKEVAALEDRVLKEHNAAHIDELIESLHDLVEKVTVKVRAANSG